MGGHYVPMDHELPDKPEVAGIFERTGCEVGLIIGRLFMFWSLADRQSVDGVLLNMGIRGLCAKCGGDHEFWQAVQEVGWLEVLPNGIGVPGFAQRFSKSARERRQGWDRQKRYRDRHNGERYESVTPVTPERDSCVCPEPKTETLTETIKPEPEPEGFGVFSKRVSGFRAGDLRNTAIVLGLLPDNAPEADRLFYLGAAERAIEIGKKPVALFLTLVRDNERTHISGKQADRAAERLRAHRATGPPLAGAAALGLADKIKSPE